MIAPEITIRVRVYRSRRQRALRALLSRAVAVVLASASILTVLWSA